MALIMHVAIWGPPHPGEKETERGIGRKTPYSVILGWWATTRSGAAGRAAGSERTARGGRAFFPLLSLLSLTVLLPLAPPSVEPLTRNKPTRNASLFLHSERTSNFTQVRTKAQ